MREGTDRGTVARHGSDPPRGRDEKAAGAVVTGWRIRSMMVAPDVPSVPFSSDLRRFNDCSYSRDERHLAASKTSTLVPCTVVCIMLPGRAGLLTGVHSPKKESLCEPSPRAQIKDVVFSSILHHHLTRRKCQSWWMIITEMSQQRGYAV